MNASAKALIMGMKHGEAAKFIHERLESNLWISDEDYVKFLSIAEQLLEVAEYLHGEMNKYRFALEEIRDTSGPENGCAAGCGDVAATACGEDEDDDPTPYCTWCGAKEAKQCECGPRAKND